MMEARDFPESDWKVFRRVHEAALARFCEQVLAEAQRLAQDSGRSAHDRYCDLYQLFRDRNTKMASLFDNPRRSAALHMAGQLRKEGLMLEEELLSFSAEARASIRRIAGEV